MTSDRNRMLTVHISHYCTKGNSYGIPKRLIPNTSQSVIIDLEQFELFSMSEDGPLEPNLQCF